MLDLYASYQLLMPVASGGPLSFLLLPTTNASNAHVHANLHLYSFGGYQSGIILRRRGTINDRWEVDGVKV